MTEESTQYPHLSKAPIVEAAIDFRVKLPADFKLDAFQTMRSQVATDYPGFEEQQVVQQMFKQEPVKRCRSLNPVLRNSWLSTSFR